MIEKRIIKKFGFIKDNGGIIDRYYNEADNWKSHLINTRNVILKESERHKQEICVILGSGWCLDVPVDELSRKFKKIYLADLIHPSQVRHKFKKYGNTEFLDYDITGILNDLYEYKKNCIDKNLPDFLRFDGLKYFLEDINPDFVVSVNILSQLAYFPSEFIKKYKLSDSAGLNFLIEKTEKSHIASLPPGKSLLITDYYETEYNFKGEKIKEQNRLKADISYYEKIQEWIWDFDLSGNYHTGNPVKFKVIAIRV